VKDQDDLLMIGGVGIFLPCAQKEEKICVTDGATIEQSQMTMTVKEEEEFEQTLEADQAEEEEEHSGEWLNIFSQEAEENATVEVAEVEEEEADIIFFVDLWEQIESLEERVKVQSVHIQQMKLETDEGGMGDQGDLPMCQKFLQLRRLHK
jgi:hypothetical protein